MIWWLIVPTCNYNHTVYLQLYLCVSLSVSHIFLVIFCLLKKNFKFSITDFASETALHFSRSLQAGETQWNIFPKLFAVSLMHPDLYFHSFTAKKRRQSCWQLPLFKASLMARQFLLPLGRWLREDVEADCDCWLWRTSQLQLTSTIAKSTHPLSSRQRHIRLCELPNLRHSCHSAVGVCERSWMMIVWSAQKCSGHKTMSPAITAS